MSIIVSSAVKNRGPATLPLMAALDAIAENADDFGFAFPSMETIAHKSRCSLRQAIRRVQELEEQGWLRVEHKVLGGKASVYFINIDRLGIVLNPKSRRSKMWDEVDQLLKDRRSSLGKNLRLKWEPRPAKAKAESLHLFTESGDIVSPENEAAKEKSGDITHPVQVTVTPESGDISSVPILINRLKPLNPEVHPPTPAGRGHVLETIAASDPVRIRTLSQREQAAAIAKVRRECNLSEPRLAGVIRRAMDLEAEKTDTAPDWNAIAERMIASQREYTDLGSRNLLRYPAKMRQFFGDGLWRDPGRWGIDKDELREQRNKGGRL